MDGLDRHTILKRYINVSGKEVSPAMEGRMKDRSKNLLFILLNQMGVFDIKTAEKTWTYNDGSSIRIRVTGNVADILYKPPTEELEEIEAETEIATVTFVKNQFAAKFYFKIAGNQPESFFVKLPYAASLAIKQAWCLSVCEENPDCLVLLYESGSDTPSSPYVKSFYVIKIFVGPLWTGETDSLGGDTFRGRTFTYSVQGPYSADSFNPAPMTPTLVGPGGSITFTYYGSIEHNPGLIGSACSWSGSVTKNISSSYSISGGGSVPAEHSEWLLSGLTFYWAFQVSVEYSGNSIPGPLNPVGGNTFTPKALVCWLSGPKGLSSIQWEAIGEMSVPVAGTVTSVETAKQNNTFCSRLAATNSWGLPNPPATPSYDITVGHLAGQTSSTDVRVNSGSRTFIARFRNGSFSDTQIWRTTSATATLSGPLLTWETTFYYSGGSPDQLFEAAPLWNSKSNFDWLLLYSESVSGIKTAYLSKMGGLKFATGYNWTVVSPAPCMQSKGGGDSRRAAISAWPQTPTAAPFNKTFYYINNVFYGHATPIPETPIGGKLSRELLLAKESFKMRQTAGHRLAGSSYVLLTDSVNFSSNTFHHLLPDLSMSNQYNATVDVRFPPVGSWIFGWFVLTDCSVFKKGYLQT